MKQLSIGMPLTLWYLAIFALGELVFGTGMWLTLRHSVYHMVDDDLEGQVQDLIIFLESQKPDASLSELQEAVKRTYTTQRSGDCLFLYTGNGDVIYQSAILQAHPSKPMRPEWINAPIVSTLTIEGHPIRFIVEKFHTNGRMFIAETGIPADDAIETLHLFRTYLLMFAPALLLVAVGVGYRMGRLTLAPVEQVRAALNMVCPSCGRSISPAETKY